MQLPNAIAQAIPSGFREELGALRSCDGFDLFRCLQRWFGHGGSIGKETGGPDEPPASVLGVEGEELVATR